MAEAEDEGGGAPIATDNADGFGGQRFENDGRRFEYVLRACRTMAKGEAVEINYGAKGNGELLRAHGFVSAASVTRR